MRLALIENLLSEPLPAGSNLLVEYDAASQWYRASLNITREWLRAGGEVGYNVAAQPPDSLRSQLRKLGLNVEEFEAGGKLEIWDWYTATLGQRSKEKLAAESLKVSDLSIHVSRVRMKGPQAPDTIVIGEDLSVLDRFNDEKNWVEYELARSYPAFRDRSITCLRGVIRDLHSSLVYKRLESVSDGIIDFRINTDHEETINEIRIRTMRNVGFDSHWHRLRVDPETFEVTLEK